MTPEQLKTLSSQPKFPATATELIRIAGLEAAAKFITAWPGQEFPVPLRRYGFGERRFTQLQMIVGEVAALAIVSHWGSQRLHIPSCKQALANLRRARLCADYDRLITSGRYSHPEAVFELGISYGISGRVVERTLKRAA